MPAGGVVYGQPNRSDREKEGIVKRVNHSTQCLSVCLCVCVCVCFRCLE